MSRTGNEFVFLNANVALTTLENRSEMVLRSVGKSDRKHSFKRFRFAKYRSVLPVVGL